SKDEQLSWLMEEYGDMVIRLAYTYVKQKQLAEDIAQEVFINCYKHLNKFQKNSSYKTWIYRIAVNKCKDVVSSWSFKNIYYRDIIRTRIKAEAKSLDRELVALEENEFIFQKVLSLPIKLREVVILHYYEDLSINEIAELLSFNANTVKTRLHRARKQLKSIFEGDHIYGG
ncbi:MAG: sigma-70 family RNA polymerase sigma factor, partial [Heyndrickxia sp.]